MARAMSSTRLCAGHDPPSATRIPPLARTLTPRAAATAQVQSRMHPRLLGPYSCASGAATLPYLVRGKEAGALTNSPVLRPSSRGGETTNRRRVRLPSTRST